MKAEDYYRRRAAEDEGFREEIELASTAMNLARNAHRLRRALGWSQTRLAEEVGTSQPRIAELEAGAGNPTLRTLTKLARALGTEVGELVATGEVWCAEVSGDPDYSLSTRSRRGGRMDPCSCSPSTRSA